MSRIPKGGTQAGSSFMIPRFGGDRVSGRQEKRKQEHSCCDRGRLLVRRGGSIGRWMGSFPDPDLRPLRIGIAALRVR